MTTEAQTYHAGSLTYTKRTLAILFFWLLWGDFCYVLMENVVPTLMPLKFKELGTSNTFIGLFMGSIPAVINSFCNPIISFKSDRYRSRWGRRIPFILFTLPFLVMCLVALGFGTHLAHLAKAHLGWLVAGMDANSIAIGIMGVAMALFAFFNTFVNSVFWYLFNDVVPEHLLARFMSWFRVVSTGAGALYNLLIFKHADTHTTEIFLGAGALYFIGFGAMCLAVKEGKYPPPPSNVDGKSGPVAAMKTYATECMGNSHYWCLFITHTALGMAACTNMFGLFFQQSLGLSLEQIGRLSFAGSVMGMITIPFSGWLADRFHPIRIVKIGMILHLCFTPISSVWLFWHPSPQVAFLFSLAVNCCLWAPIGALVAVMDPPLLMRIFPRDRYGQFCSANSLCRSVGGIAGGFLVGVYYDVITRYWGKDIAFRLGFVWTALFYVFALFAITKLYKSWQRHGGDEAYVPPMGRVREAEPEPAEAA